MLDSTTTNILYYFYFTYVADAYMLPYYLFFPFMSPQTTENRIQNNHTLHSSQKNESTPAIEQVTLRVHHDIGMIIKDVW